MNPVNAWEFMCMHEVCHTDICCNHAVFNHFFGMTMTTPWFYSFLYNGSYMVIDMALCLLVGALLWKPLGYYIRGMDLK